MIIRKSATNDSYLIDAINLVIRQQFDDIYENIKTYYSSHPKFYLKKALLKKGKKDDIIVMFNNKKLSELRYGKKQKVTTRNLS